MKTALLALFLAACTAATAQTPTPQPSSLPAGCALPQSIESDWLPSPPPGEVVIVVAPSAFAEPACAFVLTSQAALWTDDGDDGDGDLRLMTLAGGVVSAYLLEADPNPLSVPPLTPAAFVVGVGDGPGAPTYGDLLQVVWWLTAAP